MQQKIQHLKVDLLQPYTNLHSLKVPLLGWQIFLFAIIFLTSIKDCHSNLNDQIVDIIHDKLILISHGLQLTKVYCTNSQGYEIIWHSKSCWGSISCVSRNRICAKVKYVTQTSQLFCGTMLSPRLLPYFNIFLQNKQTKHY